MAKQRTYISAGEELVIQGTLVVEGEMVQKTNTVVTNYEEVQFQGENLVVNSGGRGPDGSLTNAMITLVSGDGNATITYDRTTDTIKLNKGIDGGGTVVVTTPPGDALPLFEGNALNASSLTSSVAINLTSSDLTSASGTFTSAGDSITLNTNLKTQVGVSAGTYGNVSTIPVVTVNNKGIITGMSTADISAVINDSLTGSNGILYDTITGVIAIDVGVVADLSSNQSIAGTKTFTSQLVVPTSASTTEGAIWSDGTDAYVYVSGTAQKITGAATSASVETPADAVTGISVYAGNRVNGEEVIAGIKTINNGTYTSVSQAGNVITVDGNVPAIQGQFSASKALGFGNLTYNGLGGFTYTGVTALEIQSQFSAGTGIDITSGVISSTATGSFNVVTDVGTPFAVADNQTLTIQGSANVAVLNSGNVITIATIGGNVSTLASTVIVTPTGNLASTDVQSALEELQSDIDGLGAGTVTSVTGGAGLTDTGTADVTLNIGAGTGITVNPDNVAVNLSVFSTADLAEGTNLYYTDTRARAAISAGTGISYDQANGIITASNSSSFNVITDTGTPFTIASDETLTIQGSANVNVTNVGNVITIASLGGDVSTLAGDVIVTPTGNLTSANVQSALEELQSDIDGLASSSTVDWANVTSKPSPTITLGGDLTGSVTLTELGNGTLTANIINKVDKDYLDTYILAGNGLTIVSPPYDANTIEQSTPVSADIADVINWMGCAYPIGDSGTIPPQVALIKYNTDNNRAYMVVYYDALGSSPVINNSGMVSAEWGQITNMTSCPQSTAGYTPVLFISSGTFTDFDNFVATVTGIDYGNIDLAIGAGTGITVNADNVSVDLSVFSTSNLAEGTNLYYTDARANASFDAKLLTITTDDLTEGTSNKFLSTTALPAVLTSGDGLYYGTTENVYFAENVTEGDSAGGSINTYLGCPTTTELGVQLVNFDNFNGYGWAIVHYGNGYDVTQALEYSGFVLAEWTLQGYATTCPAGAGGFAGLFRRAAIYASKDEFIQHTTGFSTTSYISIGAGNGIIVNADSIEIDTDVVQSRIVPSDGFVEGSAFVPYLKEADVEQSAPTSNTNTDLATWIGCTYAKPAENFLPPVGINIIKWNTSNNKAYISVYYTAEQGTSEVIDSYGFDSTEWTFLVELSSCAIGPDQGYNARLFESPAYASFEDFIANSGGINTKKIFSIGAGTGIIVNETNISVDWASVSTDDISEGTNLYYTDARARAAISAGTGITYDNVSGVISASSLSVDTLTVTGALTLTKSADLTYVDKFDTGTYSLTIDNSTYVTGNKIIFNKQRQTGELNVILNTNNFIFPDETTDTIFSINTGLSVQVTITKQTDGNWAVSVQG